MLHNSAGRRMHRPQTHLEANQEVLQRCTGKLRETDGCNSDHSFTLCNDIADFDLCTAPNVAMMRNLVNR